MRKLFLVVLLHITYTSNANAFDITGYCRQVSDAVGGSYQIEKSCREQEYQAKNNIDKMRTPPRIEKYCNEVANAVGGSYSIMESCIKQEIEAMQSLR